MKIRTSIFSLEIAVFVVACVGAFASVQFLYAATSATSLMNPNKLSPEVMLASEMPIETARQVLPPSPEPTFEEPEVISDLEIDLPRIAGTIDPTNFPQPKFETLTLDQPVVIPALAAVGEEPVLAVLSTTVPLEKPVIEMKPSGEKKAVASAPASKPILQTVSKPRPMPAYTAPREVKPVEEEEGFKFFLRPASRDGEAIARRRLRPGR